MRILHLLVQGLSRKEIAEELGLKSTHTQIMNIKNTLGMDTAPDEDLVTYARGHITFHSEQPKGIIELLLQGRSHEEIAVIRDIKIESVRSAINRTKLKYDLYRASDEELITFLQENNILRGQPV